MKIVIDESKTRQIIEAIKSGKTLHIRDLSGVSLDSFNNLELDTKISITSGISTATEFDKNFGPYNFSGCFSAQSSIYFTTVAELKNMLQLFERIEKGIDEKWSEMEKAVYLYGVLSKDFSPKESILDVHKFVKQEGGSCTCFSRVYCELLRRQGIEAYIFATEEHAFNMIKLGNNYYPVDVTFASNHKEHYFGRKDYFSLDSCINEIEDEVSVKLEDLNKYYIDEKDVAAILDRLVPDYPKTKENALEVDEITL